MDCVSLIFTNEDKETPPKVLNDGGRSVAVHPVITICNPSGLNVRTCIKIIKKITFVFLIIKDWTLKLI